MRCFEVIDMCDYIHDAYGTFIKSLGLGISIILSIVYIDKYKNIGDFEYKQLSLIYMIISGLFIATFVVMKNTL